MTTADALAELELETCDGVRLAARRWLPLGRPRATVVLVHGFGASGRDRQYVAMARALAADGHGVIGYDARGHGASGGLCTLGAHECHDVGAAVDEARRGGAPVVVVGASMGAIAVLRHAASDPELAGVVSVSSPAAWSIPRTLATAAAAVVTQTPPGRWLAARHLGVRLADRYDRGEPPTDLVARIAAPLVLIHGEDDRFIRPADARVLHACATGRVRLVEVPGMGHAYDEAATEHVLAGVDWVLSHPR